MLFNSIAYVVFLPLVLLLYWSIPHRFRWVLLLCASYVFYGFWDYRFLGLIALSSLVDFVAAQQINSTASPKVRKRWMAVSVIVNLGLLCIFKYLNFFIDSAQRAFSSFGVSVPDIYLEIGLPVGISFYTFQTLSYTIDVYRRQLEPERHLGKFALFVAFFPQLVAGPIERASNLLPQFNSPAKLSFLDLQVGLNRIAYGFFKKIVVADNLAVYVHNVFSDLDSANGIQVAIGGLFFMIQVYCDFSGYSDIAIGSARLLGISLMENFDRPYLITSVRQYWRKWHISLSVWVRDYIYIPLGGSRKANLRTTLNIVLCFVAVGLWHGDKWTYILFGFSHGLFLALERLARKRAKAVSAAVKNGVGAAVSLLFIYLALMLFPAPSVRATFLAYEKLFTGDWTLQLRSIRAGLSETDFLLCWVVLALLVFSYFLPKRMYFTGRGASARNFIILVVLSVVTVMLNSYGQFDFFYFQF